MRSEYDFSKGKKNPYAKILKRQITIRIDADCIAFFKAMSADTGITYQNLINLYLRDCMTAKRKLSLRWR